MIAVDGYLLGVNIGGTNCSVVLSPVHNPAPTRLSFATAEAGDVNGVLQALFRAADQLLSDANLSAGQVQSIGISCGGPLDTRAGIILSPPNLPGWDAVPIVRLFHERYGTRVALENDANASALAEWRFGAGRGARHMIFLTFGTGMGAGLILNGQLYAGANDLAGEIGHIRLRHYGPAAYGKIGSIEAFCSGSGIAQLAARRLERARRCGEAAGRLGEIAAERMVTAKDVGEAAAAGDALAVEILATSGEQLGYALSMLIDLLNPERIVIGSVYARCERFLAPAAQRVIEQEVLEGARAVCQIVPAALGDEIGDYAALAVAFGGLSSVGN